MKKSKIKFIEPNYNESKKQLQKPQFPKSDKVNFRDEMGAFARMKLEEVASSMGGVSLENLKSFGISARDLKMHRTELLNATRAIITEGKTNDELLGAAIAYSSALKFSGLSEIIEGIAMDTDEDYYLRGLAIESLGRLNNEISLRCLRDCVHDPHPLLRRKSIEALGIIGNEKDAKLLDNIRRSEINLDVKHRINSSIKKLNPSSKIKMIERKKSKKTLIEQESIERQIGKVNINQPQTMRMYKNSASFGGRDLVGERLSNKRKLKTNDRITYEQLHKKGDKTLLRIISNTPQNVSSNGTYAKVHTINEFQKIAELPTNKLRVGKNLSLHHKNRKAVPKWITDSTASPIILSVSTTGKTIWKDGDFGLNIRFWCPAKQSIPFLKVLIKMPNADWKELVFAVSEAEQRQGLKRIKGFLSRETGEAEIKVSIYSNAGGKHDYFKNLLILPPNPISVSVVPQTRGASGDGPAHYNASENRFYCYARCRFFNGYPHTVTVNRNVTCRVTDGGNHVDTFSFNIGSFTVAPNSSRTINIYTTHGSSSDIYDVFRAYGDVTMEFTFDTSEENVSSRNVWAAMAQIKLALNFVGDIPWSDQLAIQSITENEASSILEQQGLYISETRIFGLPSNDSDWSRYRDIRLEEAKGGGCSFDSDEADDLRDDWSSPTDWLDVWVVESFSGPPCTASIAGFSPVDGPTSKGGDKSGLLVRRNGRDLESDRGRMLTGVIIAHEVGHFLGLDHTRDTRNFMLATVSSNATNISHAQFRTMARHGFVERFVPQEMA